jgi:alpha-1,3-rhamnosyl/mannosyltransferase
MHVGYVPEEYLAAVYNGARALLYPSWYEGFGLPPLEMMSCGGAVLASTAGAVVETVGRRAHLIPPGDFDGWRSGMMQVLQDEDWCMSLRKGVRALARQFSWNRCAADTLAVYQSIAGVRVERSATSDFREFEIVPAAGKRRARPAAQLPTLRAG